MFDNLMTGVVGFPIHEEVLAQATMNRRVKEAERTGKREQPSRIRGVIRVKLVHLLVALAIRLAPTLAMPNGNTGAVAR